MEPIDLSGRMLMMVGLGIMFRKPILILVRAFTAAERTVRRLA